jgi:hypothetical protein
LKLSLLEFSFPYFLFFILQLNMRFRSIHTLLLLAVPTAAAPSAERVRQLFAVLETGNFTDFYALLSPASTWTTVGFGPFNKTGLIGVIDMINCLIVNPPLTIEMSLVFSQGDQGTFTSVQGHVPNGFIGTNGMDGFYFCNFLYSSQLF